MRTRIFLMVATAVLFVGSGTPLTAEVNSSGTSKANVSGSDFGSLGEPKELVRTVEEDGKTVQIDASLITSMGDEDIRIIFDKQDWYAHS